MKYLIKQILNNLYSTFGVGPLAISIFGGRGTILMFHRVLPKERLAPLKLVKGLEVDVGMFRSVLESYLQGGYSPISMDEIPEFIANDSRRRFFAVTFDDGYLDNLEVALPILKKLNIPACIYICNCFPNRTSSMWWYGLQSILTKKIPLAEGFDICPASADIETKYSILRQSIIKNYTSNSDSNLRILLEKHQFDWKSFVSTETMSWENLKTIASEKLITIGGHTVNHVNLRTLTDEAAKKEITDSKEELERQLNIKINHFAYPYGDVNTCQSREFRMAKNLGFSTAVTSRHGNIFSDHGNHTAMLPRINVSGHFETLQDFLTSSNIWSFIIHNKGKRFITA